MRKTDAEHPTVKNIETAALLERRFMEDRTTVERIGDAVGSFAGSMKFVVLHVVIFAVWFAINSRAIPAIRPFDPYPYILLNMAVSLEAVLLSTFVLMKQNRMSRRSDIRDDLNLQIDLLAEKETTKNLQLLRRICEHLGIPEATDDLETQALSEETVVEELAKELNDRLTRD